MDNAIHKVVCPGIYRELGITAQTRFGHHIHD